VSRLGRNLKKGGRVSSDTEDIPEKVDTGGVEGSNNAQPFTDFSKKGGFWFCPGVNGGGGE